MSKHLKNDHQTHLVRRARTILIVLIISGLFFPAAYQPVLSTLWRGLRGWSAYRWSTFETLWTVFWYAAIEVPITAAFIRHPEWRLARDSQPTGRTKPRGMRRPSRRGYEALVYVTPLLIMDFTMIKKFAGVSLEEMLRTGNYGFANATALNGGHKATFLVPSLHNFSISSPLQTERAIPTDAPTSRRLICELIGSLIIYDSVFFLFHLAMHTVPILRTWHIPHHSHGDIHPQVTNQLHVMERLGLVMLANFSLNIIGSHVLTRTLFVPLFVWLLVDIHNGLDSPWGYEKILPSGWGGGSKKHAAHHKHGGAGYEPFFNWCDALWQRLTEFERTKLSCT